MGAVKSDIRSEALETAVRFTQAVDKYVTSDMPWHQGLLFFFIAQHDPEGIEVMELAKLANLSSSSVSRNVAALGEWHRLQRPGLQLVATKADYRDRRRKKVVLTTKGRRALAQVLKALS